MTNAEARCNKSLRPRKPEGSLGRTAQDVHLDSHTAPELCLTGDCHSTLIDAFRLNLRACAMDWRMRFVGSRGNVSAGLLAERIAVFPWYYW